MLSGVRTQRRGPGAAPTPMHRVVLAAVVVGVLAVGAAGCSAGGETGGAASSGDGSATSTGPRVDYLADPTDVPELLREQFGEVPMLRRLILMEDSIRAQIRDPQRPENMDDWVYRDGEWTSTPVSVSVSEIAAFDDTTFVPGVIAWDRIPALIEATYDGVDLEEEEISSVSYDRIAGDPPRVYIGVSGLRGNGRLLGLADGTEFDVERS